MAYFNHFYLDKEKDIVVDLYLEGEEMSYVLHTPNHGTGNLITNLARLCDLPLTFDEKGFKIIEGKVPCYYNDQNRMVYIFRLRDTKIANIYPDGTIERKASIPAISKTLMSQTKDYRLDFKKTIVKTYIERECKFRTDLHTHMNANLHPDTLIALGIHHQIRYPLYYVRKLGLKCTPEQEERLEAQRAEVAKQYADSPLKGKYLDRKINDNIFINFADLILNNTENAVHNIPLIRASLAVMKDGQAVFTNLEKVYLYRYVFCKGAASAEPIALNHIEEIPDEDIIHTLKVMEMDRENPAYAHNTLLQDKLLWIARTYERRGIRYVEISDTTLVKREASVEMLKQVHAVMPAIYEETGVRIRFLASFRRIPLTIVRDAAAANNYIENLRVLNAVRLDPYVAGSDIVGEEINDIRDLKPVIAEITAIAAHDPSFVIRIHAGENDSLKDNVFNSIACVAESLKPGQSMPHMRIGHGLYSANLKSAAGRVLLQYIKEHQVTLEFQISSNVRLNNLSDLSTYPLKQYLKAGIRCVQGTDGGALYGTDSVDEELSLMKLLDLSDAELMQMRKTEDEIITDAEKSFAEKGRHLSDMMKERSFDEIMYAAMDEEAGIGNLLMETEVKQDSNEVFKDRIEEMPDGRKPIILCGGSFNNDTHVTKTRKDLCAIIDAVMEHADPKKNVFVIGYQMSGYEKYLVSKNKGRFDIYAFVPSVVTEEEIAVLEKADVKIRVAIEPVGMGIYKSVAYEVFKRRESVLLAFDGNSAGCNLIQEAKNAKYKCRTFVSEHARMLKAKAVSLEGYITMVDDGFDASGIMKYIK